MGKYKKEARAAKQELQFEQSIPSAPVYEQTEAGHTTPLFANGGPDCGAALSLSLCFFLFFYLLLSSGLSLFRCRVCG